MIKETIISDVERSFFDFVWESYYQTKSKDDKFILDSFIEMLSQKYDFDIHEFIIKSKDGDFIHQRIPRVKRSNDLVN